MIGPALCELKLLHKGGEVKPNHVLVAGDVLLGQLEEEPIVRVRVVFEVGVRNDLEDEAEDTVGELRAALLAGRKIGLNAVDNMKLEIEQFTVNRMLRGRVEVRLHAVELDVAVLQVLVEEAGGARQHEVGSRVQLIAELGAFLVELLAGELVNISVFDGEILLEVLQDGDVGLKIDRRLLEAHHAGIPGRHQKSAEVQMLLTGPLLHRGT